MKSEDKIYQQKYGISHEAYELKKETQGGHCYICGRTDASLKKGLNLDHNHETGQLRKFLCPMCNMVVGIVEGNPYLIPLVFQYIHDYETGDLC